MLAKCPSCHTEYDCEPGRYRCNCGAEFTVPPDSMFAPGAPDVTIAPRHTHSQSSREVNDVTMPGKRDRKPDGRFEAGDLILGRYKVLSELGQGGMGVVYKCFDETAGIKIALKALPPELSHNTLEMEDIRENFQLVSRLAHPNIAIYKQLEKDNSNGNYYLIMECVEGDDLRHWIRRKRKDGPLTITSILPVIHQVAIALDYAHEQKIIHRDIKPGNIMIDSEGHVKILDFGLAAQIHTSMTRVSMAYHGTSGTAPYMAPEQWEGYEQGAAADQYALAVMTYEILAGHLPFESADVSVLREAVLKGTAKPIQDIPKYTQTAISRAMSKAASDRFKTCGDFVAALGGQKISGGEHKHGRGAWFAAVAVVIIVLLVVGGYGVYQKLKQERAATEETSLAETRKQRKVEATRRQAAEAARKAAELAEKKRQEEEAARKTAELAEKKRQEEEAARKTAELAEKKRQEEEAARKAAELAEKKRQKEEAVRKAVELAESQWRNTEVNTIVFDSSNIKQYWVDKSVFSQYGLINIMLNPSQNNTVESIPLSIQLANVSTNLKCKVDVYSADSDISFNILSDTLSTISHSKKTNDYSGNHVSSASFQLSQTDNHSFYLLFVSDDKDIRSIRISKIVLSLSLSD